MLYLSFASFLIIILVKFTLINFVSIICSYFTIIHLNSFLCHITGCLLPILLNWNPFRILSDCPMCFGILLLRHPIVELFLSEPTTEIYHYSDEYLTIIAPFYFLLGLLAVYRTTVQSMGNGRAPFIACIIELVMRITATIGFSTIMGYFSVCIASPLAWFGACALLIPCYYKMIKY